jgi:hypothetical protein
VFVSYAGDDNTSYGHWATHFCKQLHLQLKAQLARYKSRLGVELPPVHDYEINGLSAGPLRASLQQRIASSFAMIVIVGPCYLASEHCLAEIQNFQDAFDWAGLSNRLFLVSLSERAMTELSAHTRWHERFGDSLVHKDFYRDDIDQPWVPVLRDDSSAPTSEFLRRFAPLRDALVKRITDDLEQPIGVAPVDWLVAGCNGESDDAAEAFAEGLRTRVGSKTVHLLRRSRSEQEWMRSARSLAVPFDAVLLSETMPPGVLALLDAWRRAHKQEDSVHLVAATDEVFPATTPKWLEGAHLHLWRSEAFYARLASGMNPDSAEGGPEKRVPRARLWIERNAQQPDHWRVLKNELETHWNALLAERMMTSDDFPLLPGGMDIDCVSDFPLDDADGLLLLWGDQRDVRTLVSYINKVDDLPRRRPAPGIVAYLSPPQPQLNERPVALGWEVLRFSQDPPRPPPLLAVKPQQADVRELRQFLDRVFHRAMRRAA